MKFVCIYDYDLKGIITHTGSAESGCYKCYFKDNLQNKRWIKFDNTNVSYLYQDYIEILKIFY